MSHFIHRSVLALSVAGLILAALPGAASARNSAVPVASRAQAGPTFSFPSNGQSFPLNGTMFFQVQPMDGAKGYLWSFVQGGAVMYQNLAWDGHLDGATYNVRKGSAVQRRLHGGPMQVWVRALVGNGQWSGSGSVTVQLQGGGSGSKPQPQPTSIPPTPAPRIHAGDVLYTADVSRLGGSGEWKHVNGQLVNDGTGSSTILLPYKAPVADYAVEADIQFLGGNSYGSFALRARMTGSSGGYYANIGPNVKLEYDNGSVPPTFSEAAYSIDGNFHTYRLEVRGNEVRLLVDGTPIVDAQDNHFLTGGQAGLYDYETQINVRAIRVVAL